MTKLTTALPILLALLSAGCISVLPEAKDAPPRYDVALPDAPGTSSTKDASDSGRLFIVGRVRASDEASGHAIRTADLETGRTGRLTDGELALSSEAVLGAFLRARLAKRHPGAIVCDASVAPRTGARTTVDAWIERFRLEKRNEAWFFTARIRILTSAPDGSVTVEDASPSVPVPTAKGARPTAVEAVQAISKALVAL